MGWGFNIDIKKIDNFWYYYKVHVVATIFIIIVIAITLKDCANNVTPDVSLAYVGNKYISEETSKKLSESLSSSDIISDINNDGKYVVSFTPLNISNDIRSEQDMAMQQKVMIMIAAGEIQVFFVNKQYLEVFSKQGALMPLDKIAKEHEIDVHKTPEIKVAIEDSNEEHIFAIPLEGNEKMAVLGINSKDLYIAIRAHNDKGKKNNKNAAIYDNAYKILEELL